MGVMQTTESAGYDPPLPLQEEDDWAGTGDAPGRSQLQRLSRSPLVRGLVLWSFLIGFAYMIGTLYIAPMISDAAGLQHGSVWAASVGNAESKSVSEPGVLITSLGSAKINVPVTTQTQPLKDKPRHKKKTRRKLVKDQFYSASGSTASSGENKELEKPKEDHGEDQAPDHKDSPPPDPGEGAGEKSGGNET